MEVMNLSNKQQWTLIRTRSRNGERGKEKLVLCASVEVHNIPVTCSCEKSEPT